MSSSSSVRSREGAAAVLGGGWPPCTEPLLHSRSAGEVAGGEVAATRGCVEGVDGASLHRGG